MIGAPIGAIAFLLICAIVALVFFMRKSKKLSGQLSNDSSKHGFQRSSMKGRQNPIQNKVYNNKVYFDNGSSSGSGQMQRLGPAVPQDNGYVYMDSRPGDAGYMDTSGARSGDAGYMYSSGGYASNTGMYARPSSSGTDYFEMKGKGDEDEIYDGFGTFE
jgi:hypothetical protein